ncbi:hypothetical protein [Noviherbaspirillum malthae]|uniref:hypothetical protein n=1 Tax=Noviherbaspirillum malthae TaxID=1260987 RepID=UPI00188F29D8|nr:hypothetical protein [Noviherbaspirillum malthae]
MATTTGMKLADKAMMSLLKEGAPISLGVPKWLLWAVWTAPECHGDAMAVLGPRAGEEDPNPFPDMDLAGTYGARTGYQFSWGSIAEHSEKADDDGTPASIGFSVMPEIILQKFPEADLLAVAMTELYWRHPKKNPRYEPEEGSGSWDTIDFVAFGKDRAPLRVWMHDVFLPSILPDLLAACEVIADAFTNKGAEEVRQAMASLGITMPVTTGDQTQPEALEHLVHTSDTVH